MQFNMTIEGSLEVRKLLLEELSDRVVLTMQAALYQEGTDLLNEADKLVPRDTENLAKTKFQKDSMEGGVPTFTVGYGGSAALYALAVHENPRSGKTGGWSPAVPAAYSGKMGPLKPHRYKHWAAVGEWKYLETPFKARLLGFTDRMATFLRQHLLKGR